MIEDRLRKLLEQIGGVEQEPRSTAFVSMGDADEAEDTGLIGRAAATEMRLTPEVKEAHGAA